MKFRRIWNWLRGKRIVLTDPARGRVLVRTGANSSTRDTGGQWYIVTFVAALGPPPLPRCCRGRLESPECRFFARRHSGEPYTQAKRWYEQRHGPLPQGHDLELVCVSEAESAAEPQIMRYRPKQIFEIEHPWLSPTYDGPSFSSYFGTWYGSGSLKRDHIMDFEAFWRVAPGSLHLPRWGATWR